MKKKIGVILLCAIMAAFSMSVFAGCDDKRDNQLIIWWVSGQKNEKMINDAISVFKKDYPDVEIKIVPKPSMDIFSAYKIALNDNKTRPDVAILDHVYVQSLAHDNLIANLSALGAETVKNKYPEGLYHANFYRNNAYALPLSANTIALMYNKDILKAAGVTNTGTPDGVVTPPTTIDELFVACEKVKKIGKIPFAQPINSFAAMSFMSYAGRMGGEIVSDDYKTIKISDNEKLKNALEKWKKFSDDGFVNKNEFEEAKFYTGQVAFIEMGSWNISKVTGSASLFDCGFSEMVKFEKEIPNYSGLGLYSMVVAEKSSNKAMAYKIVEYLSTDQNVQLEFNRAQNLFPVTNEALADEYYTSSPILATYASQLQKVIARPGTPVWPDLEQAIVTMLRSAILNNNVDGAITKAQMDAQSATDRLFQ